MKTFSSVFYLVKYAIWGLLLGLLILFFMPNSKLSFNWESAQKAWHFYQSQGGAVKPDLNTASNFSALSFAGAVEKAFPSVVSINVLRAKGLRDSEKLGPNEKILDVGVGIGSGIILNESGFIVTNYHVINGAKQIIIKLSDGRNSLVEIVGYDVVTDIAVLKTDLINLTPAVFSKDDELSVGDLAMAIGNPFGTNQAVSLGIISALDVVVSNFLPLSLIQTDAAINNGNSGGALINLRGEVIGINQKVLSSRGGGQTGLNYAIPILRATNIIDDIILFGRVRKNMIGIDGVEISEYDHKQRVPNIPFNTGFFVRGLMPDSPAEKAGIKVGDYITRYESHDLVGLATFYSLFYATDIGKEVELELIREDELIQLKVQLVEQLENIAN